MVRREGNANILEKAESRVVMELRGDDKAE
jgi:hypothetical protein